MHSSRSRGLNFVLYSFFTCWRIGYSYIAFGSVLQTLRDEMR